MEIIKLISAFGFGGICVKAIDMLWLQPYLERKETRGWVRDKKLIAFSKVAANFQSMGFSENEESLFKDLAIISEAQLLISDEALCKRLEVLIENRHELNHTTDSNKEIELFNKVQAEVKEIVKELKIDLRS